MAAVAGDFLFTTAVFAALAAILFLVAYRAATRGMGAFLSFWCVHVSDICTPSPKGCGKWDETYGRNSRERDGRKGRGRIDGGEKFSTANLLRRLNQLNQAAIP